MVHRQPARGAPCDRAGGIAFFCCDVAHHSSACPCNCICLSLPCALQVAPGSRIQLGRVLALKQGGQFSVGQPYVEGATVEAEVLEELKGPKVWGLWWGDWGGLKQ